MNEETAAEKAQKTTMQNVVQEMLPDDLKKQFVLQKSGGAAPVAKPTPTPGATTLDPNLVQKSIRTFESDLAEALAKKQGSSASISIAESKRKEEESRAREALIKGIPPVQKTAVIPPRPALTPIRPTSSTAIPGAAISIPPSVPRPSINVINSEINEALEKAKPPQTRMETRPAAAPIPVPVPAPIPLSSASTADAMMVPDIETPRKSYLKPIILTLVSFALIGGGIFGGYTMYQSGVFSKQEPSTQAPIVIPSLIPKDKQISLLINGETSDRLISKIYAELNKNQVEPGKNIELILTEQAGRITGSAFMEKLDTRMPDVIKRSLTDRWMLGTYGEETGQKTTFLALTTDFFQNAFAGMLMWEDSMPDDLALLLDFKSRARKDELNATSSIASYFTIRGQFSDKVIRNRDVREFKSPTGELLFLYSFINRETLLLTTTESAFIALVDRIEKDAYVR